MTIDSPIKASSRSKSFTFLLAVNAAAGGSLYFTLMYLASISSFDNPDLVFGFPIFILTLTKLGRFIAPMIFKKVFPSMLIYLSFVALACTSMMIGSFAVSNVILALTATVLGFSLTASNVGFRTLAAEYINTSTYLCIFAAFWGMGAFISGAFFHINEIAKLNISLFLIALFACLIAVRSDINGCEAVTQKNLTNGKANVDLPIDFFELILGSTLNGAIIVLTNGAMLPLFIGVIGDKAIDLGMIAFIVGIPSLAFLNSRLKKIISSIHSKHLWICSVLSSFALLMLANLVHQPILLVGIYFILAFLCNLLLHCFMEFANRHKSEQTRKKCHLVNEGLAVLSGFTIVGLFSLDNIGVYILVAILLTLLMLWIVPGLIATFNEPKNEETNELSKSSTYKTKP